MILSQKALIDNLCHYTGLYLWNRFVKSVKHLLGTIGDFIRISHSKNYPQYYY